MHGLISRLAAAFTLALLSSACLQRSLNPLFLPADTVYDARLLGEWTCDDETWTFAKEKQSKESQKEWGGRDFFEVTIVEAGKEVTLKAWLGRLGTGQFINFYPDSGLDDINDFLVGHLLGMHTFGRIRIEGDRLRLSMLDSNWVEQAVKDARLPIAQKLWPDQIILTAPASELQRFVLAHVDDESVFGEKVELVRPKPPAQGSAPTSAQASPPGGSCYSPR